MSSKGEGTTTQPKNLLVHPPDFTDYMQQALGVRNYFEHFSHFFLMAQRFMTFIDEVNGALAQGIVGKPDYRLRNNPNYKQKKSLNIEFVKKIKKVWYGRCWIHIRRDKNYKIIWWEIVFTDQIELKFRETLLYCPPLKSMNPVEPISTNTLGIMIRDYVPIKDAWWGHDYRQMITSGGFNVKFADGTNPLIESDEDIIESNSLVNVVSREYFHNMIDILTIEWNKYNTDLFLEIHKIISEGKSGGEYEEDDYQVSMIVAEEPE